MHVYIYPAMLVRTMLGIYRVRCARCSWYFITSEMIAGKSQSKTPQYLNLPIIVFLE